MAFQIVALLVGLLGLAYIALIVVYLKNWNSLAKTTLPSNFEGETKISIVIPIRNEAKNIKSLLESILSNKYRPSLIEVIIVDDHSTDNSVEIINSFADERIKLLSISDLNLPQGLNSFKKYGIEQAVAQAQGELIVTTDGDCIVPENWLQYFAYTYEVNNKQFIAAPVNFHFSNMYLHAFQCLDFIGMMIVTGANINRKKSMMCNGANMAYSKELFLSVGGYAGLKNQASGDDVMLLNKIAKSNTELIGFIKNKDATVHTNTCNTWSQLVQQRLRWATKNSNSEDWGMKTELGIVFLSNWLIVLLIPLYIYDLDFIYPFIFLFLAMFIGNYFLLRTGSKFFDELKLMRYFRISFWIHLVYIIGIGTLSLFKKEYTWKERKVK